MRVPRPSKTSIIAMLFAALAALTAWNISTVTSESAARARQNRAFTRAVCVESNKLRDGERGLWGLIIKLSQQNPNPGISKAKQAEELKQFQAYLNATFAHVDCGAVTPPTAKPGTIPFPIVTRVVTNTKTKTQTVYVAFPVTRTVTRTVFVCQLPNGRHC